MCGVVVVARALAGSWPRLEKIEGMLGRFVGSSMNPITPLVQSSCRGGSSAHKHRRRGKMLTLQNIVNSKLRERQKKTSVVTRC